MVKKGKAFTIDMARKHLAIRVIVIAILAVYLFVRDFFRTIVHSKRPVIAAYALFFSFVIIQIFPHNIMAGANGPEAELSIKQVNSSDKLTYGYKEYSENGDNVDAGYIDYSVENTGDLDLTNIRFVFDSRYVKTIKLASGDLDASGISLEKGHSVAIRAYFKKGIDVDSSKYNMSVDYVVHIENDDDVNLSNHINFEVVKRSLVITAPNATIDAGQDVPVISKESLLADNLADGDQLLSVVDGLRDTVYEVADNSVAGQFLSEDLSSEISSRNYSVSFERGTLTINGATQPDDSRGEEPDSEEPDTEEPNTEEPNTEEPSTETPSTEEPNTETPGTETPSTEEPNTETPGTEPPSTEEPSTEAPVILPDVTAPSITVKSENMESVGNIFICSNRGTLVFEIIDGTGIENETVSGADKFYYAFDKDEPTAVDIVEGKAFVEIPESFEGYLFYSASDKAGNSCNTENIIIVKLPNEPNEESTETTENTEGTEIIDTPVVVEPEQIIDISDKLAPTVTVKSEDMDMVGNTFVALKAGTIIFKVTDSNAGDGRDVSGADGVKYMLGGLEDNIDTVDGVAKLKLPDGFEGTIIYQGRDKAGNLSEKYTVNVDLIDPVDTTAPDISVTSNDMEFVGNTFIATNTAGTLHFEAYDIDPENGDPVSGVKNIICSYGGIEQSIVPTGGRAEIVLPKDFEGKVFYQAVDNSGNKSEIKFVFVTIEVEETNDLIRVKVPASMNLYVEPYNSEGQIHSSDYVIENMSEFDIDVYITNIKQTVNRDNVSGSIKKIVNVVFNVFNNGNRYSNKLEDGDSGEVYSGVISSQSGDNNSLQFNFSGSINPESAPYWKDGDLRMVITYSLKKSDKREDN